MASASELTATILHFVSTELIGSCENVALEPDSDLLASGLIDSLGVMRLVDFLERRCDVAIPPADITIEHFMTVRGIVTYLSSLEGDDGQQAGS